MSFHDHFTSLVLFLHELLNKIFRHWLNGLLYMAGFKVQLNLLAYVLMLNLVGMNAQWYIWCILYKFEIGVDVLRI